jgi:hypothetical protein
MLQCVALCCKYVAVNCGEIKPIDLIPIVANVLQCVTVRCSVLQCVAMSLSVFPFFLLCCGCVKPIDMMPIVARLLQLAVVSCSVLQMCYSEFRRNEADGLDTYCYKCVSVRASVLQCIPVFSRFFH